jgi:hypothetical protein
MSDSPAPAARPPPPTATIIVVKTPAPQRSNAAQVEQHARHGDDRSWHQRAEHLATKFRRQRRREERLERAGSFSPMTACAAAVIAMLTGRQETRAGTAEKIRLHARPARPG